MHVHVLHNPDPVGRVSYTVPLRGNMHLMSHVIAECNIKEGTNTQQLRWECDSCHVSYGHL